MTRLVHGTGTENNNNNNIYNHTPTFHRRAPAALLYESCVTDGGEDTTVSFRTGHSVTIQFLVMLLYPIFLRP